MIEFVPLSIDYRIESNQPIIRIWGRTREDQSICVFVKGFEPYFYTDLEEIPPFPEIKKVEKVKKFAPFGFQTSKKEFTKVTTDLPGSVKKIREVIHTQAQTWESDLPFAHRFEIDADIPGTKFCSVEGKEMPPRTLAEINFLANSIKPTNLSLDPFQNLRILSFDIEVRTTSGLPVGGRNPILSIGITKSKGDHNSSEVLIARDIDTPIPNCRSFSSEREMIREFIETIRTFDPDIITGFNVVNFDLKYLSDRIEFLNKEVRRRDQKLRLAIGRENKREKVSFREGQGGKKTIEMSASITGRIILDAASLIRKNFALPSYSLKKVAEELLSYPKLDLSPKEINETFIKDPAKLIEYNQRDAELPIAILKELGLLLRYSQLSELLHLSLDEVISHGTGFLVEHQFFRLFRSNDRLMPFNHHSNESQTKKGATVLNPTKNVFENVAIFDFSSLYPSLIIHHNISPDTLILEEKQEIPYQLAPNGAKFVSPDTHIGILPNYLKNLIEERKKVKEQIKIEKEKRKLEFLEAKQNSLKILANSFYGAIGWEASRLFNIQITNAITAYGRSALEKATNLIKNKFNTEIIYGDSIGKNEIIMLWKCGRPLIAPIQIIFILESFNGIWWRGDKQVVKCKDLECLSLNLKTKRIERKRVREIIRHWKPKIWRFNTMAGSFEATGDHSILNGDGEFEDASELETVRQYEFSLLEEFFHPVEFDEHKYDIFHLLADGGYIFSPTITPIPNELQPTAELLFGTHHLDEKIINEFQKHATLLGFFKVPDYLLSINNKQDRIEILEKLPAKFYQSLLFSNLIREEKLNDFTISKILSKEEVEYNDFVYDLSVEHNENFLDIFGRVFHNTDSCWVELPEVDDFSLLINSIKEEIENETGLKIDFEKYIKKGIITSKKRYALLLDDDSIETKGIETVRREWPPLVADTIKLVLSALLKKNSIKLAKQIVRNQVQRIKDFNLAEDDPTPFLLTRKITKDPRAYKSKPGHIVLFEKMKRRREELPSLGDRIEFVVVSGRRLVRDRCETVNFARQHNLNIDKDYYINHLLLPPVMRILSLFNVSTDEILHRTIQLRL